VNFQLLSHAILRSKQRSAFAAYLIWMECNFSEFKESNGW